jgi:uncharacterized damage-inducible protein DinB
LPQNPNPEPWLRGPLEGIHPFVMPVFFSFAQVREDLARHTAGLAPDALWKQINGASLGFELKHIAGSVDRLATYLIGEQLSPKQLEELKHEHEPDADLNQLLAGLDEQFRRTEQQLTQLSPDLIYEPRSVGRRALPTTVLGLIVHLCEHTQRHLGQAITLAKMLK